MKAYITSVHPVNGAETIDVNGHKLQYGGADGDGYCYGHQSFQCMERLSVEEQKAIDVAADFRPGLSEAYWLSLLADEARQTG